MSTAAEIETNLTCIGCGKPLPHTTETTVAKDGTIAIKAKVDWRAHVLCVSGMLSQRGEA